MRPDLLEDVVGGAGLSGQLKREQRQKCKYHAAVHLKDSFLRSNRWSVASYQVASAVKFAQRPRSWCSGSFVLTSAVFITSPLVSFGIFDLEFDGAFFARLRPCRSWPRCSRTRFDILDLQVGLSFVRILKVWVNGVPGLTSPKECSGDASTSFGPGGEALTGWPSVRTENMPSNQVISDNFDFHFWTSLIRPDVSDLEHTVNFTLWREAQLWKSVPDFPTSGRSFPETQD